MNGKTRQYLSERQAQALFEYLTHVQIHLEIEQYKYPDAISNYGIPFQDNLETQRSTPLLQSLLVRLGLKVPGLKNVSKDFWKVRCRNIIQQLGEAQLSESYDKGSLSRRKTLATASSTVLAPLAQALIGGVQKSASTDIGRNYDCANSEDLVSAWNDFINQLVYGSMVDELIDTAAKTDQLSDHTSVVQAAHEYILVNIASFLYQIFVRSPDGQVLLRLAESVHRLIPYAVIRQTLRVSNAATMIYGMTRLLLSKLSVGSITNWIGISNGANEGMNLLQHIISTVYTWEIKELQRRALRLEGSNDCPGKNYMNALKAHVRQERREQENRRQKSQSESKSIIIIILEDSNVKSSLSQKEHDLCMEYLSIQLSIYDREVLSNILCRQQPDHLTQSIYDLVAAYDPIIRSIHDAVNLSSTLADLEGFITDFLKCAKVGSKEPLKAVKNEDFSPSVEDFAILLRKHVKSFHRYLHLVTSNCKDLTEQYRSYAKDVTLEFRPSQAKEHPDSNVSKVAANLDDLISSLDSEDRDIVLNSLDKYMDYLTVISAYSSGRLHSVLSGSSRTFEPPGTYPARWRSLIDRIPVTPDKPVGSVRYGRDISVRAAAGVDVDGEARGSSAMAEAGDRNSPEPPDMEPVTRLLLQPFRASLDELAQV